MNVRQRFELTVPVTAVDHWIGAEHAPVTVVEYGDFECPMCLQASHAVRALLAEFANRVRLVFRHFPLEEVHPHALLAAQAAECAGAQGKFWQMHNVLFDNQRHLKLPQLHGYAENLSLDMATFTAAMNDQVYLQRIREHQQSGLQSGVRATPTFYINGKIYDVSGGLHSLADGITAALRA
jgi:protein-disulfide isomerase